MVTSTEDHYQFPCSFSQQRLWVVNQLTPHSSFYNIHAAVKIPTAVNSILLGRALNQLVERHETLRTSFALVDDKPVQVVGPPYALDLPIVDLSHLNPQKQEAEIQRAAERESQIPFDLERGPLLRVRLLSLGLGGSVLLLTIHHIIADAWSMGILFRELSELYAAHASGREARLPELPIQYADFSVWQREWLQGDVMAEQLAYWREQLADLPSLELPLDYPRPPIATYHGRTFTFNLPVEISEQVGALGRRLEATPFMVLLAAFALLLQRYSGQDDLVVGVPIANRNRPELENIIGFFVNSLVLRLDVTGNLSFLELVRQVRTAAVEAYAHQDLPFEKLVEELQPERNLSRNPLFQVTFQVLNTPSATLADTGDDLLLEVQRGTANFDFGFDLWQTPTGFSGRVDYASDLFDDPTIARMVDHYKRLLTQGVLEPEKTVSTFTLLDEAERQHLLEEWSGITTPYPREATIHALFSTQAAATPSAVALRGGDRQLTYGELNRQANRLAHHLLELGIRPEEPVGICCERSPEMVIAILAVLKAGGAYLAIDPTYPAAQIAFMIEDAGLRFVACDPKFTGLFAGEDVRLVLPHHADSDGLEATDPPERTMATGLAYVAYTSGSTGTPKGVCALHRGAVRLVRNTNYASFGPDDSFLLLAPLAFDASTLELWGPLLNGGQLVIFPPGKPSLEELQRFIAQKAITVLWLTAGLFNQMAEQYAATLASVKQLLAGGDVLSPAAVLAVLAAADRGCLINGYGPTEGTTFTCCHVMSAGEIIDTRVPIGKPIANTRVYVLDRFRQLAPIGVPGELYIGGDGVARGYLNRPALTAAAFVPNPFAPGGDERLYRTGDLVRWRRDGTLDFLGRIDRQVKVRGFRVEPGEVEGTLEKHPGVRTSVVLAKPDRSGDKRLCAYVVPHDHHLTPAELHSHLVGLLPGYLIPSEIVLVDKLPLNANGKVDIHQLQASTPLEEPAMEAAPEGEVEEFVADLWAEILGLSRVGAHANFFIDLHGHSLLATQVISRLRAALDLDVPLRAIFEYPTVREFSFVIEDLLLGELEA